MIDQVAAAVRRERIARELSLSELARRTGIAKATLSAIERAQANPRLDTLTAIAAALGVELVALVGGGSPAPVLIARGPDAALHVPGAELRTLALAAGSTLELEAAPGRRLLAVAAGRLVAGPPERPSELEAGDLMACPPGNALQLRTDRAVAEVVLVVLP